MRWFVEVAAGSRGKAAEQWVVEADGWQAALKAALALRGDVAELDGFSVELLDPGYRAIDPRTFTRFVLRPAPADAPLSTPASRSVRPSPAGATSTAAPAASPKERIAAMLAIDAAPHKRSEPAPRPASIPPHGAAAPPAVNAARPSAPPIELPPPQILMKREEDPTEASPLTYRESAWLVPEGTSPDVAARVLRLLFDNLSASLAHVPAGKLIHMAVFDQRFERKPLRPPLGVADVEGLALGRAADSQARRRCERGPSRARRARVPYSMRPAPTAAWASAPSIPSAAPAEPSQTPSIALAPTAPAGPTLPVVPESRGSGPVVRLRGDDLITELFEQMHDLHFSANALDAAEFVLTLALDNLPSRVGVVHFYDIDTREFVVVRAKGRGADNLLLCRSSERDGPLSEAMHRRRAVLVQEASDGEWLRTGRYAKLGYPCHSVLCAPVELAGRFLGAIEVANPRDGGAYSEGDGHALTYMGEQLAEYLAQRGVILDPERIKTR